MSTDPRSADSRPSFELLPAIDVRAGRVVRLTLGEFDRETRYADDPAAVAEAFADAGARWIHVVDLDGAREGGARQRDTVRTVVERVRGRAACQVAGGLRDEGSVARALADGAARVVVGTAALANISFAAGLVERHGPARVVVALDVRSGRAVGHAWRADENGVPVEQALHALAEAGVERFAVTAIERDGTLLGPDLHLVRHLAAVGRGAIIASAGIRTVDDLLAVRDAGAEGAIVGKALYEGRLDLAAALAALS